MTQKSKTIENFEGLLKHRKGFHFLNSNDLIRYFIQKHYPDKCVTIILDCKTAFASIPKLNILKRDDYSSYLMGLANDFVIIEFDNVSTAEDYVFGFPIELKLKYLIYKNGELVRTERGKL